MAGVVRTQATTINASSTETEGGIKLALATVFGTQDDFSPLPGHADTTLEAMEIVYDEDTHYSDEIDIDEHEEREDNSGYKSATSY